MIPALKLYADGGAKNQHDPYVPNEAYGSYCCVFEEEITDEEGTNKVITIGEIVTEQFGNKTNTEAEYMALLLGLRGVRDKKTKNIKREKLERQEKQFIVYTDSSAVYGHIYHDWKCKPHLREFKNDVKELLAQLGAVLVKVPRAQIVRILGH